MSERDELQAQTAEEARAASAQAAAEALAAADHAAALRRLWLEDLVAHTVAFVLTLGFFILALCVLLGLVDIKEPAVATMVGTIIGLAAARIDPLLARYFKAVPAEAGPEAGRQAGPPPATRPHPERPEHPPPLPTPRMPYGGPGPQP